jgi:hypothetical protein
VQNPFFFSEKLKHVKIYRKGKKLLFPNELERGTVDNEHLNTLLSEVNLESYFSYNLKQVIKIK